MTTGLPTARNETYVTGTPLNPLTMNDLQDGERRRHFILDTSRPVMIGALAWKPNSTAAEIAAGQVPTCDGFEWEFSSVVSTIFMWAELRLPTGIQITGVTHYQSDSVISVFDTAFKIRKRIMPAGSPADIVENVPDVTSAPMTAFPMPADPNIPYTVEDDASIILEWNSTTNTHLFGGAKLFLAWPPTPP